MNGGDINLVWREEITQTIPKTTTNKQTKYIKSGIKQQTKTSLNEKKCFLTLAFRQNI